MRRIDQKQENCWDISRLFATDECWESSIAAVSESLSGLASFHGRLGEGAEVFAECLLVISKLEERVSQIGVYANQRFHEDTNNTKYQGYADRADTLNVNFETAVSFFKPEILALPNEKLSAYEQHPSMADYRHYLNNIRR